MESLAQDQLVDGKYRIVRFLGQGAWASVYEGINVRIQRRVAIKVLSASLAENPSVTERFEREAQAATRIESAHVVNVFDLGALEDGRPYIVMELLEGENLGKRLETVGALAPEVAVNFAVQALHGLGDAHAAGILHRDVKPDNVVLTRSKRGDEIVKIVDFGISKLHSGVPQPQANRLTQTNTVLGSPVYMSPEQCRGTREMDHRSDLFSLGVVLFEALTGQLPHTASSFNELLFKIALEDAPDPRSVRPEIDAELAAIVLRGLAREPEHRYQTAAEFREALVGWAESKSIDLPGLRSSLIQRSGRRADSSDKHPAVMLDVSGETMRPPDGNPLSRSGVESAPAIVKALTKSPTSPMAPISTSTPAADMRGGGAVSSESPARLADTGPAAGRSVPRRGRQWLLLAGVLGLLVAGGLSMRSMRDGAMNAAPSHAAPIAAPIAAPERVHAPEVIAPATIPNVNGAPASAEAADASAEVARPASPASGRGARGARGTSAKPAASAVSASAAAPAPAVSAAAPAPAVSNTGVVDGRTIHVTF